MGTVSVIVPAFNAEVCLKRCLDSILNQEHRPTQVIVINDGSTDGTAAICNRYQNNLIYLEQNNLGPAAARNRGLSIANGNYIAFLDADDYWGKKFLAECVSFLKTRPELVAVSTGQSIKIWGHPVVTCPPILNQREKPSRPIIIDSFFDFWADQNHVTTGSALLRSSVIREAGYQREDFRICEDLEYWGYIATFGKWGFIPEVLWYCDPTPAAASQGWLKKHAKRWKSLPNIEDWESRIKPRLKREDIEGFEKVKARVVASLVHQNILAGNLGKARSIFPSSRKKQPKNWITRLLSLGNRMGSFAWIIICKLLQFREHVKALGIYLSTIHGLSTKVRK